MSYIDKCYGSYFRIIDDYYRRTSGAADGGEKPEKRHYGKHAVESPHELNRWNEANLKDCPNCMGIGEVGAGIAGGYRKCFACNGGGKVPRDVTTEDARRIDQMMSIGAFSRASQKNSW